MASEKLKCMHLYLFIVSCNIINKYLASKLYAFNVLTLEQITIFLKQNTHV